MRSRLPKGLMLVAVIGLAMTTAGSCEGDEVAVSSVRVVPPTRSGSESTAGTDRQTARSDREFWFTAHSTGALRIAFTSATDYDTCLVNFTESRRYPVASDGTQYYVDVPHRDWWFVSVYVNASIWPVSMRCKRNSDSRESPSTQFVVRWKNEPEFSASPATVDFGTITVGQVSAPKTVTITNTGTAALHVNHAVIEGPDAALFRPTSYMACRDVDLEPRERCQFEVTFTTGTEGPKSADMWFVVNGASQERVVALTGSGTGVRTPTFAPSPASLDFGPLDIAGFASKSVTVTNTGLADLTFFGTQIVGDDSSSFSVTSSTCQGTLPSQGWCQVTVQFAPKSAGARTATLRFTDNAVGSPHTVALSGTGTRPAGEVAPTPSPTYTPPALP